MRCRAAQKMQEEAKKNTIATARKVFIAISLAALGISVLVGNFTNMVVLANIFLVIACFMFWFYDTIPCILNNELVIGKIKLSGRKAGIVSTIRDIIIISIVAIITISIR